MFGFITRQAGSVAAQPRPRLPIEVRRATPRTSGGARQTVGVALVAIGQRVAGEMPAAHARQPDGDCA
jgi:hypothetical protein